MIHWNIFSCEIAYYICLFTLYRFPTRIYNNLRKLERVNNFIPLQAKMNSIEEKMLFTNSSSIKAKTVVKIIERNLGRKFVASRIDHKGKKVKNTEQIYKINKIFRKSKQILKEEFVTLLQTEVSETEKNTFKSVLISLIQSSNYKILETILEEELSKEESNNLNQLVYSKLIKDLHNETFNPFI